MIIAKARLPLNGIIKNIEELNLQPPRPLKKAMIKKFLLAFLLFCQALWLNALEPLPQQPARDGFLNAYCEALRSIGVNASYEELACVCGLPFAPLRKSATFCGRDVNFPYSCENNVQRLNNFYRLRNDERTYNDRDRLSESKRTEYRKLIADSAKEGIPSLQYCKLPGELNPSWQFVVPGEGLSLKVVQNGQLKNFQGVPEKVWLLKKSNRPAPDTKKSAFIFENLGKLLSGTAGVSYLVCGLFVVNDLADNSYTLPWCPVCQSTFNNCIQRHLQRWQADANKALELFPWLEQLCTTQEEKELLAQAQKEYARYAGMFQNILNNPAWERPQTDIPSQSALGEQIRALGGPLSGAAECFFALANSKNSLSAEYYSPTKRSQLMSDKLAHVIVDMQIDTRYEGSLATALAIAGQLSGSERPVFVLRGIAGLPFRLCLRTNDWYFCREINEGIDMATSFLNAAGFEARYVSSQAYDAEARSNINTVKRIYDCAVRKLISNISDSHHAAVGANLNRSGQWGVIAGYSDYGFTWRGRTVLDTKPQLTDFTVLPTYLILVGKALPKPAFEEDVSLALSRWTRFIKGSAQNGYLSGGVLFNYWKKELSRWELEGLPTPDMAGVNRSLWNTMIDGRADALTFVNHLITAVPVCAIPLTEAKEILEQELTMLRSTLSNGNVLGFADNRYIPPEFKPSSLSRQADALRRLEALDQELLKHLAMAQKNLQR